MRSLRREAGLTQTQVAERMGLAASAQTQICRYEAGRQCPRIDQLLRFLDATGSGLAAFSRQLAEPARGTSRDFQGLLVELDELARRDSR